MKRKIPAQYFSWVLLCAAAGLLAAVLLWSSGGKTRKQEYAGSFVSGMNHAVVQTDSLLRWLDNPMFLKDPFPLLTDRSFLDRISSPKTTIFISRNDTLLFWSDNHTPWPSDAATIRNGSLIFNGNGYYFVRTLGSGAYRIMAMVLVQSNYFYHNAYLPSEVSPHIYDGNDFFLTFDSLAADTAVVVEGIHQPIWLMEPDSKEILSTRADSLWPVMLLLALVFLAISVYRFIQQLTVFRRRRYLRRACLLLVPLLISIAGYYLLSLPRFGQLSINNPAFFAFSSSISCLTPLLMAAFALVLIVAYFSREVLLFAGSKRKMTWLRVMIMFFVFCVTSAVAYFILSGIDDFLFNTSIAFGFNDILTFDPRSVLIFFTLFLLFAAVILLHFLMISLVGRLRLAFRFWLFISLAFLVVSSCVAWLIGLNVTLFLSIALWLLVMQFAFSRQFYSNKTVYLLMNLVLAAGLTTFALNHAQQQKQYDQLKLLSLNLASEQDPLTEEFLGDLLPEIQSDSFLLSNPYRLDPEFSLNEYLKRKYFNGYLSQYLLQSTWCRTNEQIIVQPADTSVNCVSYFSDIAFKTGIPTLADHVVFINDGTGRGYYLCSFRLDAPGDTSMLFVELVPASYEKGLGYPDLLVDANSGMKSVPANVSYCRYLDGVLVSRYGKFNYPTRMSNLFRTIPDEVVVSENGFVHYKVTISDHLTLILTENDRDVAVFLAPFSYILLFFGLFTFVFIVFSGKVFGFRFRVAASFSSRLQWMIVALILLIFFVAGIIAVLNLGNLNSGKNKEIVSEKAHSLIIELEHKLSDFPVLGRSEESYVNELLLKFSRVFFTDLNMYTTEGQLLATTRPQIFEKQLISDRMNASAFMSLSLKNNSFLLQTEEIGEMTFTSAYIPVRNNRNEIIAYLNLPYFARESELNQEISSFISTFINIYMLIILLTVLITIVVSNYVTKPLRLIKDKLRNIKLGVVNEKISWKRRDEIGDLVFEYNRMIEELAFKAELLARNERELAWREMAKQVAHEIKNPLTPMKLSTQYLEKAWRDNAKDFDERLKRYSQTMVEQIDSLSDIATAFSNFGKLPESTVVRICINDILSSVVTLYRSDEYDISLSVPDKALYVLADESQMLRVFNNLLKNAQQAFVDGQRGNISVTMIQEDGRITVIVKDNGCGIPDDMRKKIFQPNFTTKSSGSGLGLAMVRNIVTGFGGQVSFESESGKGTSFMVVLPIAE